MPRSSATPRATPRPTATLPLQALDLLAVAGLAVLAVAVARMPILTPDVWWHLATGRWIAGNGIPHQDPFSYTLQGVDWKAHEWLADRILYAWFALQDLLGVVYWRALLMTSAVALAYRLARVHAAPVLSLLVLIPAAYATQRNWLDRPQLWTFVLVPLLVLVLERARLGKRAWLCAVPCVLLLWVNVHGGFMLGIGIVGLWTLGTLATRAGRAGIRPWLVTAVAAAAATLLNPNGIDGALYPLQYVGSGLSETIQEEKTGTLSSAYAWVHATVLGGLLLLSIWRRRTVPPPHLAVALALAWLSMPRIAGIELPLAAERHAPLLLLAGGPLLCWRLQELGLLRRAAGWRTGRAGLVASALLALVAIVWAARALPRDRRPEARLLSGRFPEAGTEWLRQQALPGNIINPYRWGGYLAFHLWPDYRVWIDSRGDVYGPERLREYMLLHTMQPGNEPAVQDLLNRYDANVVVWHLLTLDLGPLQVHPFADWLLQSDEWRLVFYDRRNARGPDHPAGTTAIFVREDARNAALLQRLAPVRLPPLPGPRRPWAKSLPERPHGAAPAAASPLASASASPSARPTR